MTFREKVEAGKFVVTAEVAPPKGIDCEEIIRGAELFKDKVDAVNVTDMQSAVLKASAVSMCVLLKQHGFEPVYQMTCRDRNRLALQADLFSAAILGIENVLVITGDHPSLGDHPHAKSVFDLDAVQLLNVISLLESGKDMAGKALKGTPKFFAGAAVNPGADPLEPEIIKMEKKIKAGAKFFQTQAVYDVKVFENFINQTKHMKVPVLAGIVLLKSAGMARFMNKNVAGVSVPEDMIKEMEATKDKKATSVQIGARIVHHVKDMCQGIHMMPLGWDDLVGPVLDLSKTEVNHVRI